MDIRLATIQDYENCGECSQKEVCAKIAPIWQHNPQAKKNLEEWKRGQTFIK